MLLKLIASALAPRRKAARVDVEARLERALAAHREERYGAAVELLRELAARDDADPDLLYLFADSALQAAKAAEGLAPLRRALRSEFSLAPQEDRELLTALVEMVWSTPAPRWEKRGPSFEQYGWLLHTFSAQSTISAGLIDQLARLDVASVPDEHAQYAADATLRLLDYRRGADPARIERIMLELIVPWMRRAAERGHLGLALRLENKAYAVYVIGTESEQHFSRSFAMWSDFMRAAGRRKGEELGPLPASSNQPPRVAFFLHSGNFLAHTRVVFDFLEALREITPAPLVPLIIHRGRPAAEFARRAAALGVECRTLGESGDFEALRDLRALAAAARVDALVWVSVALSLGFAFAMRVAPIQIWWALKYHGVEYPEIDGYLTSGSAGSTKRIGAKLWRSAPLAAQDWYEPGRAEQARTLRAKYAQHEVLLACLGREEKLNSEPFLVAVAKVLKACPQAGFLWTGRDRLLAIETRLHQLGVAERCHYIGWIDTKVYAQVMDVFLDSFPFPCAFTLYEAMAAGKAVVTYASPEAAETGLPGLLGPLLAGESGSEEEQQKAREIYAGSLYFCARDAQEYLEMAVRLVGDAGLRRTAGEANRRFVAQFLSDRARTARILAAHIVELIGEARQRS